MGTTHASDADAPKDCTILLTVLLAYHKRPHTCVRAFFLCVPGERIELSHLAVMGFESIASTNSAIPASLHLTTLYTVFHHLEAYCMLPYVQYAGANKVRLYLLGGGR